jgi:hypothetical protein
LYTPSQRKELILKLFESGLLATEDGKISNKTKEKVLNLLGYAELDGGQGICALHEEKAEKENQKLLVGEVLVDQFDDHKIHALEHTRYVLTEYEDLDETQKSRISKHIKSHEEAIDEIKNRQLEN